MASLGTHEARRATVSGGPFAVATGSTRFVGTLIAEQLRRPGARPAGSAVPLTGFDPQDPAVLADPYPAYRRLLRDGPVHYNRRRNTWVICGYDAVRAALRADDVLSSVEGVTRFRNPLPMMISTDRPEHTRLRRLVTAEFSRAGVGRWQQVIDTLCGELVGGLVERGGGEVVGELAVPLPMELIVRILGIPMADRERFHRWSHAMVRAFDVQPRPSQLPTVLGAVRSTVGMRRYLDTLLPARRADPGEDVLSRLLAAGGTDGLTEDELYWFVVLLVVAGNETTTNLIAPLLRNLARHPDQYALLRERPELIPAAVEEQLRVDPPVQGFYRSALEDYEVDGRVIPAGARVLVLFASANRDPAHYPHPDEFRVERGTGADHLAFGSGIHFCLGAFLSRMEVRSTLAELVTRVSRIERVGPERWTRNPALRGLVRLPVRLIPA
jgi:beta-dihydromenaquinone-9 omega-hydroxylase